MISLSQEYEKRKATPSDINEHLEKLVECVKKQRAQLVIELGVGAGNSTCAFLFGLKQTGGTLFSLDNRPECGKVFHGEPQWIFHCEDDLRAGIPYDKGEADIVFIDTSHEYKHTLAELQKFNYYLKRGGYFIMHDMEAPGVRKALKKFLEVGREHWPLEEYDNCHGLGILTAID